MRLVKGIALMCTVDGQIVDVLRDAWACAEPGMAVSAIVRESDATKCANFFGTVAREGTAFGWEMHIGDDTVVFAAFVSTGPVLLIGTEEPALIERLHQELMGMNNEMTNTLREAYKQQALARRNPGPSLDEFAKLSNEMSSLHREITKRARDLEQINRDYERRQMAMAELDQRREHFLQHLVHDLRSPLTSVNGAVGMALGGVLGPIDDAAREALVLAKEGCDRLTEMISSILDTAKAESGQLDVKSESIALEEMFETIERDFRNRATEKKVSLHIDIPENVYCNADRAIVRRVLGNYLVNALKFSPSGTTITIAAVAHAGRVRISVVDEGPGIPEQHRERLFTKYGQIERRGMSTGLGLSFCKEMVKAMGGTVGVESVEGRGATFWFELPRAQPPSNP
ncbi:MAG TPA: HAMP domain-containing sensor histidine kinase [Polyangium sp.]|nr:HAMP domain-containing sensor histidine kinase [Polyangium sp.]